MKPIHILLAGCLSASHMALAQTGAADTTSASTSSVTVVTSTTGGATGSATAASTPQPATASVTAGKLTAEFANWAGSEANAAALVNGLRTGSTINLQDAQTPPPPGTTAPPATTTSFSPTTKPMGYGNIRIALSLARVQLANQGITNPTAGELQGALIGMPDSSTQGVLQMRADGMGWGQIASSMGVKLGSVMSGKYVPPAAGATTQSSGLTSGTGTTATTAGSKSNKGIVTASGGAAGGNSGKSSGITGGSGAGKTSGMTTGMGNAYGKGGVQVVNAAGAKAGGGVAQGNNAGGQGKGGGKP